MRYPITIFIMCIFCTGSFYALAQEYDDHLVDNVYHLMNTGLDLVEKDDENAVNYLLQAYEAGVGSVPDSIMEKVTANVGLLMQQAGKADSAMLFFNRAFTYYEDTKNTTLKARTYIDYSALMVMQGVVDSVAYYLDKGCELAHDNNDSINIAYCLFKKGQLEMTNGNFRLALENLNAVKDYFISSEDWFHLKFVYNMIGIAHLRINNPEACREALFEGLKVHDSGERNTDYYLYNNLGRLYQLHFNDPDSALVFYNLSKNIAFENGLIRSWVIAMINIGNIYESIHQPEKAGEIYLEVIRNDDISAFHQERTAVTINLGVIQFQLGKYVSARFYIEEGLRMAQEGEYLQYEINAMKFKLLMDSLEDSVANVEEDLDYYVSLIDSSYNITHSSEISELKVQYETEQSAIENNNLKKQDLLNRQIIKKQRAMLWILFCGIAVLISMIVFILFLHRKQRKLAQQLQESNITKDKLFSIIAHDLKSPMSGILSTLQILDDETIKIEEEDFRMIINELRLNTQNSTALLKNLLQWSKNQRLGISNNPEEISLNLESKSVTALLHSKIASKKLTTLIEIDDESYAWCDPMLYRNTLFNILSNAVKFTDEEGTITISAKQQSDAIKICVSDNGVGIAERDLNKLFRIETGFHTIGTANEKGTGLGLAMCKEYVDVMGGEISVESTPGKGSTFCFTIPVKSK